jgi:hypothetical protein
MGQRYRSRRARLAALSAQLRAEGQSWAAIARIIADQERVNARVALRLAHGWTQEQVAILWNGQWPPKDGSAGITDKNISYWETWPQSGAEPSVKTLKRLAQLYQCDVGQLIDDGDYRHLDEASGDGSGGAGHPRAPVALAPLPAPGPAATFAAGRPSPSQRMPERLDSEVLAAGGRLAHPANTDPHAPGDDEDVDRRAFLGLGLGGSAALAVEAERLRLRLDATLAAPATSIDVDEWERTAWDYACTVNYVPPERIASDILVDLHEVSNRLTDCPDRLRPRLMRVCGQFAAMAAVVLLQLGDPGSARRYWRTAIRAADQSGDPDLRSLLRGRRAHWAARDERSMSIVLDLADETVAAAGERPCAGLAYGHSVRAMALARLGRHAEAQDALGDLSDVFARLPESATADRVSQWGWSQRRLLLARSTVYSLAGAEREASAAQDAVPALCPPFSYQDPATVELDRATCLIVTGDPGEGARHVVRILQPLPAVHRRDVDIRTAAQLALSRIPDRAHRMPDVVAARELLALPAGR